MMYKINKNIYLVFGAYNACIYNLNTKRLIPIAHDSVSTAQQLFLNPSSTDCELFQCFLKEEIIVDKNEYDNTEVIELENDKIQIAWIEINTTCNFKCIHCYVDGETHATEILKISLADFKYAVDQILSLGIHRLHIIGGEPLVHPDFWEMMEYAVPKFDFTVLFTNGYLLDKAGIYRLVDLGLSEFDISLYSTIPEEHEKVTLKLGSYQKTMDIIGQIEETGAICHIATVRVPGIDIGAPYHSNKNNSAVQHFDYMRASGRGQSKWGEDELLLGNKAISRSIVQRKVDPQKILFKMKYHNCFGRYIRINPELYVYPCTMEQRFCHGNLHDYCLSELIQNNIREFNKDKVDICCACEYRYICSDCRPDTFSPEICAKPWFCTYDPLTGHWKADS